MSADLDKECRRTSCLVKLDEKAYEISKLKKSRGVYMDEARSLRTKYYRADFRVRVLRQNLGCPEDSVDLNEFRAWAESAGRNAKDLKALCDRRGREIERLRKVATAAEALGAVLDAIGKDPQFNGVFALAAAHNAGYAGLTWGLERQYLAATIEEAKKAGDE